MLELKLEYIKLGRITASDQTVIKSGKQQLCKIAEILSNYQVSKCSKNEIESILNQAPSPELWGFCDQTNSSSKTVIFQCIIPTECWYGSATDKQPEVYMRFGLAELGKWNHNIGPGDIEMYVIILVIIIIQKFSKLNIIVLL